jgi:hypothetical protein
MPRACVSCIPGADGDCATCPFLERDANGDVLFFHARTCTGGCDYACGGEFAQDSPAERRPRE